MKNVIFILFFYLFYCTVHSQGTENEENPFEEGRINYFKKTILVFNEYLDTKKGSFNTTNVRLILPIGNKSWNVRADIPLVSTNTESIYKTGLGDLSVGATYIPYIDKKRGIAFRTRIVTNSAIDPKLGSGKWIIVPTLYYGSYLDNNRRYLWFSSLEYQSSFAGSNNRNTINTTLYENLLLRYFGKNWIGADIAFRYNATLDGFQNNSYLEFGRKFTPNNMFYIHPSVAFGGQKAYNYGIEVGILTLF
ncbi:lipid A phosphoethanolamine transferase [Flavobacterium sp. FlaQc-51]|jgi:hypothetical protein|uniref:lipid A phosphoethanolamine transferase n=1 Tax=Flavobacterium sp. FlaQc-51 TaxID=3374184 RepID=UPI003756F16F